MTQSTPAPRLLGKGDMAPFFHAKALSGAPNYAFDTAAGRYILMLFFGTAKIAQAAVAIQLVARHRTLFDDDRACFFGITVDPVDETSGTIKQAIPGIRWFLDYDRAVSSLYGATPDQRSNQYAAHWLVLDPTLRVIGRFRLADGEAAIACLAAASARPFQQDWAPVLLAPDIFEPALCRKLIKIYDDNGGEESGFMRDIDGKTVLVTDPSHKVRRDFVIESDDLRHALQARIKARLVPMVKRIFQFEATRMERYLIGCYDAASGGHFRAHRDNTTFGTAHRRFAVTINLNADEYEGGELRFPEYGRRTYRPPTGGAVVFSCSLLHEATPVTRGTRYAFLPFLYDETAAAQREQNNAYLDEGIGEYSKALPDRSAPRGTPVSAAGSEAQEETGR